MNAPPALSANQITIAVTVFSRRQYVKQAVASALAQTVPVRVIVVEDCGPDPTLREFITGEFGTRIEYFRNPKRRGLFGNWNACLEYCRTPWLSILHDDDWLAPGFAEAMLDLSRQAPACGLYFGQTTIVDERGQPLPEWKQPPLPAPWRNVTLVDVQFVTPFPFAGQLFRIACAQALGGFRETSQYCGDWEMWTRLIANHRAAQTAAGVAFTRLHAGWERGTNAVVRAGKQYPLSYVQHKRVLRLMRERGSPARFDRSEYQRRFPMPIRFLLRSGARLSPRLLAYHVRLLLLSPPPHWRYAFFQTAVRVLGVRFVHSVSCLWDWWNQRRHATRSA
jgi:glycosyltransferase involved in cell wall biosynthesis